MAELDDLYRAYLLDGTGANREALLEAVLKQAKRHTRDDDCAADVALTLCRKLPGFNATRPDGFSRFVSSVCSRTLKSHRRKAAKAKFSLVTFDERAHSGDGEPATHIHLSALPNDIRSIATLLLYGQTISEAAAALGATPEATRQKLRRFRHAFAQENHKERDYFAGSVAAAFPGRPARRAKEQL